ncbi:MAG: hypothetical protein QOE00_161, partial [Ilumatobacteraceae bacterium]
GLVAPTWNEGPLSMSLGSDADDLHPAGTDSEAGRSAWEKRSDLKGSQLQPRQSVSLVVVAQRDTRQVGSFDALDVDYRSNGGEYRYRTRTIVVVQDSACG